jgi:hypothetical protein
MPRPRLLLCLTVSALLLSGCGTGRAAVAAALTPAAVAPVQAPTPPTPVARLQKQDPDKDPEPDVVINVGDVFAGEGRETVRVLVNVNGQPILAEEIREACMANPGWLESLRMPEPERSKKQKEVCNRALQELIDREVVMSEIQARIGKNKPEILDKIKKEATTQFNDHLRTIEANAKKGGMKVTTRDDLKKVFQSQGLTLDGYKRQFERNFIRMQYMQSRVFPMVKGAVNREQIYDYYEQHPNEFEVVDSVKWQHIFIDAGKFPSREEAGRHAAGLAARARAGEDFVQLALKHDQGDSSYRHGEGSGKHRGEITPTELEPVLFQMKDGEVSLTETAGGFHVARMVKREYAGRKPLDDKLQGDIRKKLMNEMMARESRRIAAELRRKATVERAGEPATQAAKK